MRFIYNEISQRVYLKSISDKISVIFAILHFAVENSCCCFSSALFQKLHCERSVIFAILHFAVENSCCCFSSALFQKLHCERFMTFMKTFSLKVVSTTFLLVSFLSVNESTYETRKSVFLSHSKSSFRSRENQILEFYIFKFHDLIKWLSIKQ